MTIPGIDMVVALALDSAFAVAALLEALSRFGRPEIFNTDQGSQFTSAAFTAVVTMTVPSSTSRAAKSVVVP